MYVRYYNYVYMHGVCEVLLQNDAMEVVTKSDEPCLNVEWIIIRRLLYLLYAIVEH